jgi:hypothetical protein
MSAVYLPGTIASSSECGLDTTSFPLAQAKTADMSIVDLTEAAADALRNSADLRMAVKAGEVNLAKERRWLQHNGVVTEARTYAKTVDFDRTRKQIEDDGAKACILTPDDNGGSQAEAMAVNSAVVTHEGLTTTKHSAASTYVMKVAQQQPSI